MGVRIVTSYQLPVAGKRRLGVVCFVILLVICGCGARPREINRIALLAPFEGRYREVGYNMLYAARLALQDFGDSHIELLAVDDGGSAESAVDRARALAQDPLVKAIITSGYAATDKTTQRAFADKPVIVVGNWGAAPETDHIYILANPLLNEQITTNTRMEVTTAARTTLPLVGGEVFALETFAELAPSPQEVRIVSSANLPEETFTERYLNSGLYVPQPGLLATLTYDAFGIVFMAMRNHQADLTNTLTTVNYEGLNGTIRFENGYWQDAPINYFTYDLNCVERGDEMCLIPAGGDS